MTEETKIIQQLKNLKKAAEVANEKKFISDLRIKLSNRIMADSVINQTLPLTKYQDGFFTKCLGSANTFFTIIHPRSKSAAGSGIVINKSASIPWYLRYSLANAIVIPHALAMPQKTVAIVFIVCLIGISSIALVSQRSLPGDTLYPIKILSEEIRSSLAYSPESEAIIHTSFTAKRVAEVKAILEQKDISPEVLDIALTNLQKNTNDTAVIINAEGQKGTDVADLAKNINESLDENAEKLKQIFNDKKKDLKKEEIDLKNKIDEAAKASDQALITSLTIELDATKNIRKTLETSWSINEKTLKEDTHQIENQMNDKEKQLSKKNKTEKIIAEAKKEKQQLINELLQKETAIATPDMFNEFDFFLNMSEKAYKENKYDDAEAAANESISKLKIIENAIEKKDNEKESQNNVKSNLQITNKQRESDSQPKNIKKESLENNNKN